MTRGIVSLCFATLGIAVYAQPDLITSWTVVSNVLPAGFATRQAGGVITKSNLYFVGGNNNTDGDTDKVWRLSVLYATPTLGAAFSETALPKVGDDDQFAYVSETTIATDDFIYLCGGGWNNAVPTLWDRVHHIAVNPGGDLGPSWIASTTFPNGYRLQLGGVAIPDNGFLYVFGGADDSSAPGVFFNDCYYAQINPDGTLGAWQTGTFLPESRWFLGACSIGNSIIVTPGVSALTPSSATVTDEVIVCTVNPSGTMGSWVTQAEALPAPLYDIVLVAVDNTVFAIGGRDDTGAPQSNVWRATFDTGTSTVGAWTQLDAQLPAGTRYHAADYSPDSRRLYVSSVDNGADSTNEVYVSSPLFPPPPTTSTNAWSLYR
jgi:hypothetical protein